MTDEILPEGEDGGGTSAAEPTTPRKTTRTRAPAAKAAKAAKPVKATSVNASGSPSSRSRARAVRPQVEVVEDDTDAGDDPTQAGAGLDAIATGPSPEDEGRAASSRGLSGEDEDDDDDDLDAAADDPERSSTSWPTGARQWVASHLPTTLVGVVAVALAVALILTLLALGNKSSLDSARTSALSAARADAVKLAGYDYRHLDRDFGAVVADSTPSFRRKFTQAGDALKNTLSKYHAIAVAHVVSAGLVSATTSRAVALVFLTQKVTNSTQKNSTSDRSQVEITLVRSGGRWLIDQVNLL
jgi:Mce-associated membrane protein